MRSKPRAFISYRRTPERRILVQRIATLLHMYEFDVWWDSALVAGQEWQAELDDQVKNADVVVPLWCSMSIHSSWVKREAALGRAKLVPVLIQAVTPPTEFASIQAFDLTNWNGDVRSQKFQELVRLLSTRFNREALSSPPPTVVDELASLPATPILPVSDPERSQLLSQFRGAYVRLNNADFDEAESIDIDSAVSELLGDNIGDYEKISDALRDLAMEAGAGWWIMPESFESMETVGDLIEAILHTYSIDTYDPS